MIPLGDNNLIRCTNTYGPTFGGYDIYICNNSNINGSSYANFPTNYNIQGPNIYVNDQPSKTAFCGATNGHNFKVIEYEVYQVIYN